MIYFNAHATMGWFKQLCLSWIILSVAAACVSCQELRSTLREGNQSCSGEEIIFNCAVRGPLTPSGLTLAWRSDEYISRSLQLSTADGLGAVSTSSMNGIITATARVTNIANVTGELVLESTLRITAVEASTVTCMSSADGGTASIEFFISAVPGLPQRISAAEISQPRDNICIILVTWDPPANSDPSDIDQYIVYVPSRDIRDVSSSTLTTLTVTNCGNDIRIQVAAVNLIGCVGMNSSEVQLDNIIIPTGPTDEGATTTEGGSASTPSQLGAGDTAGIIIAVVLVVAGIGFLSGICIYCIFKNFKNEQKDGERLIGRIHADDGNGVKLTELCCRAICICRELGANEEEEHNMAVMWSGPEKHEERKGNRSPMECLIDLYITLKAPSHSVNGTQDKTSDSDNIIISAVGALRAALKKTEASVIREQVENVLVILKDEDPDEISRALDCLMKIITDMSKLDDEIESDIKKLRDEAKSSSEETDVELGDKSKASFEGTPLETALNSVIDKVLCKPPDDIRKLLLTLCDILLENLLKLSHQQEEIVGKFEISSESLKKVETVLTAEFARGLESERENAQVKMFVHEMPKETEEGEFLVVDLRVKYLRVLHIKGSKGDQDCEKFSLDKKSYERLFDFIVECITEFIKKKEIGKDLPVAFTFPFAEKHEESLTSGKLIRWKRDSKLTGGEGEDVVQPFKKAASDKIKDRDGKGTEVSDATGILLAMGNKLKEPDCCIGLALGNGANACYLEELDARDYEVINTDWGAFGGDDELDQWRTDYDRTFGDDGKPDQGRIDYDSQHDDKPTCSNTKQKFFEKMISDSYQSAIVYCVLKDLIDKKALFGGKSVTKFDQFDAFCRGRLGIVEGWDIETCKRLLNGRFRIKASYKDCEVIRRVCVAVSTRAARLAAAGIVALVKKINKTGGCTVAVDSTLSNQHPQFLERIQVALDELEPGNNIKIKPVEYGSRLSADFAAAMLRYYVDPPPSSIPGSSVPAGTEGQEEQRERDEVKA